MDLYMCRSELNYRAGSKENNIKVMAITSLAIFKLDKNKYRIE